jgi:hypothetical protein
MMRTTTDKLKVALLPVEPIARAWAMYERYGAEYEAHWESYMDLSDKSGDGWKKGVTSTTLREMDEKLDRLVMLGSVPTTPGTASSSTSSDWQLT